MNATIAIATGIVLGASMEYFIGCDVVVRSVLRILFLFLYHDVDL